MLRAASLSLLVLVGCKPAEEPARRVTSAIEVSSSRPGMVPPEGNVRVTERIELPNDMAPPIIRGVEPRALDAAFGEAAGADAGAIDGAAIDGGPADGAAADGGPAKADGDGADASAELPTRPEDLSPDLIASLAKTVPASAREEARKLNKTGLEAHKKLALDAAADSYRAALVASPAFPYARYNLACALALQKRDGEALFHLAVLAYLADTRHDTVARERLDAARVDADFELLRDDLRFRALTGATGVLVSWVAGGADVGKKEAQRLVKALREARWPARLAKVPWQTHVAASTIAVASDDPIAERAAKAIDDVIVAASPDASAAALPVEVGTPLPPEAPPIVVIVDLGSDGEPAPEPDPNAPQTPEPAPTAPTVPTNPTNPADATGPAVRAEPTKVIGPAPAANGPLTTLSDAIGKRLRAERATAEGSERHTLELKSTGFFTWEVSLPSGVKKTRNGRWSGGDTQLVLNFKETTETPAVPTAEAPASAPKISIADGMRADIKVAITAAGLSLDGLVFR